MMYYSYYLAFSYKDSVQIYMSPQAEARCYRHQENFVREGKRLASKHCRPNNMYIR